MGSVRKGVGLGRNAWPKRWIEPSQHRDRGVSGQGTSQRLFLEFLTAHIMLVLVSPALVHHADRAPDRHTDC